MQDFESDTKLACIWTRKIKNIADHFTEKFRYDYSFIFATNISSDRPTSKIIEGIY